MPLSWQEVEDLLSRPILGHLAVVWKGRAHVSPVWVYLESRRFYFTTRLRRVKGKAILERPYVSISIATNERPYKAVIVEGKAELVEDEKKWAIIKKIAVKYGKEEGERWLAYSKNEPDRVAFAIKPARILSWHYGRGDYRRQNEGASMKVDIT